MSVPDLASLYAKMETAEQEKAKKEAEAAKDYSNPNFVNMKPGNAYEFRLVYWASGVPGERVVPIIEKTVHAVKVENGDYHEVTCPSSDYLMGRGGFRACPICSELSKLWDEKEKGSAAAKIAYDKFKRKFKGYAVVYVVNDPTTPENNGTFKILYINAWINPYLREKIKGIDKKGAKIEGARPIGFKAFDPSVNGKNLLITVTKDGEYSKYSCEFVDPADGEGKIEAIPEGKEASYEFLQGIFEGLKFDEYYTPHEPEKIQKFHEDVFLEREEAPAAESKKEEAKEEAAPAESKEEAAEEAAVPEAEEAAPAEEAQEEKKESTKADTNMPDIDAILDDLTM